MDILVPGRIGAELTPLDFTKIENQYRAVRSASTLVLRPASYTRGVGILLQLVAFKGVAAKARQLLYAALESSGNLIMQGKNTGKMEVDEDLWRSTLETAVNCGQFSEHQVRNMRQWLKCDWSTIVNSKTKTTAVWSEGAPMRLRMAETVLQARTSRFSIVLENLYDDFNQQAVLRTADCFGIQNIHVIAPDETRKLSKNMVSRSITKKVLPYLTVHQHKTTAQCIASLKESGHEIWATDLSPGAVTLTSPELVTPKKLAVVFGRELDGCSKEILAAADRRVFIPIYGFAESLNLTVAASLVMQSLFTKCPQARGDMTPQEKAEIRARWYDILGHNSDHQKQLFRSFLDNPPPPLDDIRRMDKICFSKVGRNSPKTSPPSSPRPSASSSSEFNPPAAKKPKLNEEDF